MVKIKRPTKIKLAPKPVSELTFLSPILAMTEVNPAKKHRY